MKKKELESKVDEILWRDWDPIGVNDIPEARDEYSSYVPSIARLVQSGTDVKKVAHQLMHHANVNMGMHTTLDSHMLAAEKLHAIEDV